MVNPDPIRSTPPPSDTNMSPGTIHRSQNQAEKEVREETQELLADNPDLAKDIEDFLARDPETHAFIHKLAIQLGEADNEKSDVFTMAMLFEALIDLGQALQGMATAQAERLSLVSQKMSGYARMLTQIPVLSKNDVRFADDDKDDTSYLGTANQRFGNWMEAIRANKGIEEDKAKKIQTLMQTMKDAGQSASDFLGTFIDLIRGISSKITSR